MEASLISLARATRLLGGEAAARRDRNRAYLMRLSPGNLLLSHYLEAGLIQLTYLGADVHGGWDSPVSPIRGTFAGHWLSAAARHCDEAPDPELKARADYLVSEIGRCQKENGGEWCFPIPEKYLHWLRRGKRVWAPQYVCHKTMMGLLDMYRYAGNEEALSIARAASRWFHRFTTDISRQEMTAMMALEETGGMMEYWADLYAVTGDAQHLDLVHRYERPELFEPLAQGVDVLTNMHANSTIPEAHGAARAYEVTGEQRYRRIAEAYWDFAVRKRGMFATGGQTSGEIWTPPGAQAARLGELNQEHCTVYNMMRLSEYLLRWTGVSEFADYWERNYYNGILAQGHWEGRRIETRGDPPVPPRGLIAYFLPLGPGSRKAWGSETGDFWCCHCTLVQAHANHREGVYYAHPGGLTIAQYFPTRVSFPWEGAQIVVTQTPDALAAGGLAPDPVNREVPGRPRETRIRITLEPSREVDMELRLRLPWWLKSRLRVTEDGRELAWTQDPGGYAVLRRRWRKTDLCVSLAKGLSTWPLPDRPDTVAFLDGPVVLAGLVDEERELRGDPTRPETLLQRDDERHWGEWRGGWHTVNQPVNWRMRPLHEIGTETYTVYFPVRQVPAETV